MVGVAVRSPYWWRDNVRCRMSPAFTAVLGATEVHPRIGWQCLSEDRLTFLPLTADYCGRLGGGDFADVQRNAHLRI